MGLQEKSESDEKKKERELWFCTHSQNECVPSSISLNISPHCLMSILLNLLDIFRGEKMKRVRLTICLAVVCVMAAVNFASADTIRGISMDFVTIGNAGNAGDTRAEANPYGCGAVSSNYRIGKYEVTAAQWQTINTAAGIGESGTWSGNQPVANISWYGAAQFCNYLTSGNKYSGAYKFDISGNFLEIDRASSISTYGTTYVIPTEDEWYKAAYFKPNASGYSLYANGLNTIPAADLGWNYFGGTYSDPWSVGTGGIAEQNGTFDMMGNVWEWNEILLSDSRRGHRGGSCVDNDYYLTSSGRNGSYPYGEYGNVGFRVASVPEPCSLVLLSIGGLLLRRERSKE
jgi:formylglycine-generating enzyme required for sulfatase activity